MTGLDLREWRRTNHYTQNDLSEALGVSRQTIVSWEASEGPLSRLVELALVALLDSRTIIGRRLSAGEARKLRQKMDEPGSSSKVT